MGELLILLLQFLAEMFVEALFQLILDFILNIPIALWPSIENGLKRLPWPEPIKSAGNRLSHHFADLMWNCFWIFFLGWIVGGVSLLIFSHTFIKTPSLRMANLLYAPVMTGLFAYIVAKVLGQMQPRYRFFYAFSFTLGITLMRFFYAQY